MESSNCMRRSVWNSHANHFVLRLVFLKASYLPKESALHGKQRADKKYTTPLEGGVTGKDSGSAHSAWCRLAIVLCLACMQLTEGQLRVR